MNMNNETFECESCGVEMGQNVGLCFNCWYEREGYRHESYLDRIELVDVRIERKLNLFESLLKKD